MGWPKASTSRGREVVPTVVPLRLDVARAQRQAVGVVARPRRGRLGPLDPALGGERAGVDHVDVLLHVTLQHAGEHGRGEQARVEGAELALVGELQRRHRAAGERPHELAELARQRQEGPEHRERLGAQGGDVDRRGDHAAGEGRRHLLGDDDARAVLGLLRRGPQVGRHDHARHAEERALGHGLLREDVDAGAAEVAALERLDQRLLVDHVPAGRVDHARAGLHGREGLAPHEPARLGRRGQVQADEVADPVEVLGRRRHLHAELAVAGLRHERVVGHHPHAEALGPLGHHLPDAPEPQDAERLAGDLDPAEPRALPAPLHQARVGLRDVACLSKQQGDGVLGRREGVRAGRVHDHDPPAGRGLDIDVVDARAGPADHLQAARPLDHVGRHLGGAAHHEGVVVGDPLHQLVARQAHAVIDREALGEIGDAGLGDPLADEHAQIRAEGGQSRASAATRWAAATPAPSSTGWPRSASTISSAPRVVRMSR